VVLWEFVFSTEVFSAIITSKEKSTFSTANGTLLSARAVSTFQSLEKLRICTLQYGHFSANNNYSDGAKNEKRNAYETKDGDHKEQG
jgi:hypothetical protein